MSITDNEQHCLSEICPHVEVHPNENLTTVMPEQYRYTLPVKQVSSGLLGELTGAAVQRW